MVVSHPQSEFTDHEPHLAHWNPQRFLCSLCVSAQLASVPTASPLLVLRCLCATLTGTASHWLVLHCAGYLYIPLAGLTQPLRSLCVVLAELCPPGRLCADWYSRPLFLAVSLVLDQIIPCRSLPLTALQTRFEFLSNPAPEI